MCKKELYKYVEVNRVEIKTIFPNSTDLADLEAIGGAVADFRTVILGEQDHSDGPTFLARTKTGKYLLLVRFSLFYCF